MSSEQDNTLKKAGVASLVIGAGLVIGVAIVPIPPSNPTRPPRQTRGGLVTVDDGSIAVDKVGGGAAFYGKYCQYFELHLHAHKKANGMPLENKDVAWRLAGGSGVTLDDDGLLHGSANPPADAKCGDEFVLQVDPVDSLPQTAPKPSAATAPAPPQPRQSLPEVLPTPEMKAKDLARQRLIDTGKK